MSNFNSVTNEELLAVEGGGKAETVYKALKFLGGLLLEEAAPAIVAPLKMIEQYRR
jgi:hypothetical protein